MTKSKTAVVELFALQNIDAFNYGELDLNRLGHAIKELLNIRLDKFTKTYTELKARKGSDTKYPDELEIKLQHKM